MLTTQVVKKLSQDLQRIFSLKISKSTFREVQNAVVQATKGDKAETEALFQSLYTGKATDGLAKGEALDNLYDLVEHYNIPVRVAKDVLERGDLINMITSEVTGDAEHFLFVNRIRRVDGEEFQFITEPASTLHIVQHFISRLHECQKKDAGVKVVANLREQLQQVKKQLDTLVDASLN